MVDNSIAIDDLKRRLHTAEARAVAAEARATATEAKLRERDTRSRNLMGTWAQAEWETNAEGVVVRDSPSWRAYTGQTLDEWLGYGWLDAIHPDDRAYAEKQWREAMATNSVVDAEFRLRSPDGDWRWTNVRAVPILDERGTIEKWAGMNIDINDRKQAEAALRESEVKYRTLFDTMGQGYALGEVIRDDQGRAVDLRYLELNPAFERLSGIPVAEARGRTVREVYGTVEAEWFEVAERVARLKVHERVEYEIGAIGRWFQMHFYPAEGDRYLGLYEDVTERKRAEAVLRESEARQAFLLRLSDALRAEAGVEAVGSHAVQMIAEELAVDRVYLVTLTPGDDRVVVTHETRREDLPPLLGSYRGSDFPSAMKEIFARTIVYSDVRTDARLSEQERMAFAALDAVGFIAAPIRQGNDTMIWAAGALSTEPRVWTTGEITLFEEAVERTWAAVERARAETALATSEERFRQFGRASSDGLWIRDAASLKLEYASDAMAVIYGLSIEAMTADPLAWPALIVPEDREETLGYIERVKAGESVVHEFRIQRQTDLQFRWIRSVGFPLVDEKGIVTRIAGISSDITEEKLLTEHQAILMHELQHRVRNIMGIIRSIGNRSAGGATSVDDYRQTLEGRMLALARVQTLLTREANTGGSMRDIIESEVKVQAHHPHQFVLIGPDIVLSPKAVEVLTMAFHELSTNALKYGAFSVPEGKLTVSWSQFGRGGTAWVGIDWVETGAPPRQPSTRRGFGSELIEGRIPYELGGTGKVTIEPSGARCRMEFPLQFAESILETDAPMPSTTFGGTIDMSGAPDLAGRTVLVIEDDYYMAADTVAALRGAGALVLGPCPNEETALELIGTGRPSHALVDLNLGGSGPRFEIARRLKSKGIPFVFITGYDLDVIPPELTDVPRLSKPVQFRSIVEAVDKLPLALT